jgi:hypothetical protein
MGEAMPSLQIRDLPEPLHRLLQHRAQAHKRSLSASRPWRIWRLLPALIDASGAERCWIASPGVAPCIQPLPGIRRLRI